MRAHPLILAVTVSVFAATAPSIAEPQAPSSCGGEACGAIVVGADGCTWTNASKRAVRFSLISGEKALVMMVLAPGEAFSQADKTLCVAEKNGTTKYHAAFVVLRQMPEEVAENKASKAVVPRAKPVMSAMPAPPAPLPQSTLASAPSPRTKPASKPVPRSKPEAPVVTGLAPAVAPVVPLIQDPENPCGDACAEILFKVVDDCLWVQTQNPKAIMFQATVDGHMVVLALEGANASKADGTQTPKNAAAYHARQPDPFQSSSAGIPVFRARLGGQSSCVKERTQISHFVAVYKK